MATAHGGAGDRSWEALTLREKIGQTMIMLPDRRREVELGGGSLEGFFERYPVSGFFMGWKLFDGVPRDGWTDHVRRSVEEYQRASRLALLFQEDYEQGVGLPGMTELPRLMSVGAAGSPELARAFGQAIAREARSVGVRWVLNPVADLNMNPANPVTNTRSVADDPERAVLLLREVVAGLQEGGVAATAKHFPGDGVDSRDQHLCTTANTLPLDEWWRSSGRVFRELSDAGVMAVMPGHIALPAWQRARGETLGGFHPPATLSLALLTDLLKGEIGFRGVIVSDAMMMGGFRGWYPTLLEGEIRSFVAGVDAMLWPSYEFMDELERRILAGDVPMARLEDAVRRVWEMKRRLGLFAPKPELVRPVSDAERSASIASAARIAEGSLTLVRDRKRALPLDPKRDRRLLVVAVTPRGRKGGDGALEAARRFRDALASRGFAADFQHDILYETDYWRSDLPDRYDRIVVVAIRAVHQPFGPLLFWDDEAQSVWGINAMPKDKIVLICMGSPYLVEEYFERVDTCINAYSADAHTSAALVKALLGEIPFAGSSPVAIRRRGAPGLQ